MFSTAFSKFKKGQAAMAQRAPGVMPPMRSPQPVAAPVAPKSNHPIHMLKMPKKFRAGA